MGEPTIRADGEKPASTQRYLIERAIQKQQIMTKPLDYFERVYVAPVVEISRKALA
jgi:hypothetical protein